MEEALDLCDERGRPLGRTKPRSEIHRDGDWHRSFHCWLVTGAPGGDVEILLQLRPPNKDTSPNLWDVSVGGHYSAGEGIEGGIREMREELGLQVEPSVLIQAGWRHGVVHTDGIYDREVQDVYFLCISIPLEELRPDPNEVPAVACVSGATLLALAVGRTADVEVRGGRTRSDGTVQPDLVVLRPDGLVPRENYYYEKAVRFARTVVQGAPVGRRRWW